MMNRKWNIRILEKILKSDNVSPLKKYFAWEILRELKEQK